MSSDMVLAPFTPEQVERLNAYQQAGLMHPFTCGSQEHRRHWSLLATEAGWVCPARNCGWKQNWAHRFMAEFDRSEWPTPFWLGGTNE